MKKIISLAFAATLSLSLFAADIFTYAPISGNVKSYTKTEYSIASKFGNYFRTPSVKFLHTFDGAQEIESGELTPRDAVVNKIVSTYDEEGRLSTQTFTNSDGDIVWKSTTTYKDGLKIDYSEYDATDNLKDRTIFTYENGLLVDESSYDGEGTLLWKTIYKYNSNGRTDSISEYEARGTLSERKTYAYNETGAIDSITYYDADKSLETQEVFRYGTDGVLNEITTYDATKQISKRVLIKYDTTGNVNRVSEYEVSEKFGTIVNDLVGMSEYVYEYGSKSGTKLTTTDSTADAK